MEMMWKESKEGNWWESPQPKRGDEQSESGTPVLQARVCEKVEDAQGRGVRLKTTGNKGANVDRETLRPNV